VGDEPNSMGISSTFKLWKQYQRPEEERLSFYQQILLGAIGKLEEKTPAKLTSLPVIISGMASANIGMMNLPYKEIPFSIDGHDLNVEIIAANNNFGHPILLVSGAKTINDVMRGEEVQLLGSIVNSDLEEQVFIFPGTHSKHVMVKNETVSDVRTYMTGEFFNLLTTASILSSSIEKTGDLSNPENLKSFEKGVDDSLRTNILSSAFQVRINDLFKRLSKQQNYCYLSGLLIGTEFKELDSNIPYTIVCDESIYKFYKAALQKLNITAVNYTSSADAVIRGHRILSNLYKSKLNSA
ncbi:MAG: 2-dehydro-3-deoxygalactonokinase, partial [Ginsengibacter sp.]